MRNFEVDKANHFLYGAAIGAGAALVAIYLPGQALHAWAYAAGAALAAGLVKEAMDYVANAKARRAGAPEPSHVERADVIATMAGGLPVAAPLLLLSLLGRIGGVV